MEIYPAVDLYQGKVVRLERGDYSRSKIYSEDPVAMARKWREAGARWLHVVDLEGAKSGAIKNWIPLQAILESIDASVQFGGGVRTREDIEKLLRAGVKRVILGSKVLDLAFLKAVTESYGNRIVLSLDLRGDQVQIEGWLKSAGKSVFELWRELAPYRIQAFVVTDIERDGTLTGMNLEKIQDLLEKSGRPLILSGGISSLEDVRALAQLRSTKLQGVIIGKALYEGKIDLKAALNLARGEEN